MCRLTAIKATSTAKSVAHRKIIAGGKDLPQHLRGLLLRSRQDLVDYVVFFSRFMCDFSKRAPPRKVGPGHRAHSEKTPRVERKATFRRVPLLKNRSRSSCCNVVINNW